MIFAFSVVKIQKLTAKVAKSSGPTWFHGEGSLPHITRQMDAVAQRLDGKDYHPVANPRASVAAGQ